jgi:hypothetical protein
VSSSSDAYLPPDMKCNGNTSTFTCQIRGSDTFVSGCSRTIGQAHTEHLATVHATDVGGVPTSGKLEFDEVGKIATVTSGAASACGDRLSVR